jgi:para-aminobenzoate synthetase component 1
MLRGHPEPPIDARHHAYGRLWMTRTAGIPAHFGPPGRPPDWRGPLQELERWTWSRGEGDPRTGLADLLDAHGLAGPAAGQSGDVGVVLLAGAVGCAALAGLPEGTSSPVEAVPEVVAVAVRRTDATDALAPERAVAGRWTTSWTDGEHAAAVEVVRAAIARGQVYQANVVGHRWAPHRSRPVDLARAVCRLPGATYGGVLTGEGWAVGSASPEQLVRVEGTRVTTVPVKGTLPVTQGSRDQLRTSAKDRAEHVMIVDLERNDLSRVARTGTVDVEELYAVTEWAGLWHAGSRIAARLRDDVPTLELLAALLPGGSVTGAPKRAACALLADLEPVGRGPSMGAFGLLWPGGVDLGLTIRTVAADEHAVHLWAGGGITWDSDPAGEVAEAHAKAAPVVAALA